MINKREGISLIVLVITIIIIIILSGSVILTLFVNNPINSANEAAFKSDLDAIASDLNMYQASQYAKVKAYSPDKLDANNLTAEYDGTVIEGKTIKDIIPVLSTTNKYNGQFEVINGKLVYVGTDRTNKKWAQDVNVEVIDADRLDAIVTTTTTLPISAGTDVIVIIKISSNSSINNINLTNNLELLDQNNISLPAQPVFEIGVPSGTELDTLRTVDVTIKTNTLAEGIYKLKLKPYSISNIYDVTNVKDIVTGELFEIDNTPPINPEMSAIPTGWTNLDVIVSITYPLDSVTKEYGLDGTTWNSYTNPITVNTNNTTIYARAIDIAGNQSGQSSMTIANIDRESPIVVYGTNGGNNLQVASTKVTLTDVGVSGVNITSLKYIWDTQNVDEPTGEWNTFANDEVINKADSNGTYYLWIKASDNTGNSIIAKSNAFVLDNIVPVNPIMSANPSTWTNGNVTVTITYSSDAAIKEYSTDAATWNTYIAPVVITTNNTTVYARATDASGNQSQQSTMTVANIDKVIPTAIYITNGGTNIKTASTVVTASDAGGSNIATLEYVWDMQNATIPSSGWTAFTNAATITKSGVTGSYYLWIKVVDNAGNNYITKSNIFAIDNILPIITLNTANVTVYQGTTYTDTGVTASDNIDGNITANIVKTGTVNTNVVGTYTLTYNVTDNSGNAAVTKTRTVNVIQTIYTFDYTSNYETFTVPYTGNYQMELWGAQGGGNSNLPGKGGYTKGDIYLNVGQVLYVYVGNSGYSPLNSISFNGGGKPDYTYGSFYGGGGATDIRLVSGNWNVFDSLKSRIMVAAGGGSGEDGLLSGYGGAAGGLIGGNSVNNNNDIVYGATQTSGYAFGIGQDTGTQGIDGGYDTGSGGGGYYGGYRGLNTNSGGSGGSSFISGYTGCDSISSSSTQTNIIHTNQPNHYSGFVFANSVMKSGAEVMPNPLGGTITGKNGNGFAKIVYKVQ